LFKLIEEKILNAKIGVDFISFDRRIELYKVANYYNKNLPNLNLFAYENFLKQEKFDYHMIREIR
jgi:hypothetical protein